MWLKSIFSSDYKPDQLNKLFSIILFGEYKYKIMLFFCSGLPSNTSTPNLRDGYCLFIDKSTKMNGFE